MSLLAGGAFTVPAYHIHAFGHRQGMLVIRRGALTYKPFEGNRTITAPLKNHISILQKDLPAQGMRVPDLCIYAPDQGGKERKYEMITPMFLPLPSPKLAANFHGTPETANKTRRPDEMVARIINESLQEEHVSLDVHRLYGKPSCSVRLAFSEYRS